MVFMKKEYKIKRFLLGEERERENRKIDSLIESWNIYIIIYDGFINIIKETYLDLK